MRSETTVVLLFSVATAVAIAVRYIRFPYTVALVLVGLGLGALHLVPAPHLTKELLFAVILPGLLFEASFNIDAKEFWASRLTIGALAVPGVGGVIARRRSWDLGEHSLNLSAIGTRYERSSLSRRLPGAGGAACRGRPWRR